MEFGALWREWRATAAGALATTERGAMGALPDREVVDELVARDGGVP